MTIETNSEEIKRQVAQAAVNLGHEGFVYVYLQEGRLKMVGDISLSSVAPLLLEILAKKMSR